MDLDPDPTPFFTEFKDAKKIFFFNFLITYPLPQAHYLQSFPTLLKTNY